MPGPHTTPAPSEPPRAPGDMPRRRWWRTNRARVGIAAAIPALGLLEPRLGGLALIAALIVVWWDTPWPKAKKVAATVAAAALLGAVLPDPPKEAARDTVADAKAGGTKRSRGVMPNASAAPSASGTPEATEPAAPDYRGQSLDVAYGRATKAGFTVTYHDASEKTAFVRGRSLWTVCFQKAGRKNGVRPALDFAVGKKGAPCPKEDGLPVPWPTMPELVWKTWRTARTEVVALGVRSDHVQARAAYRNDTLPDEGEYDDWRVCAHDPAEGAKLPGDTRVTLYLSTQDNGCPEPDRATGTSVNLPDRDDDGDPDYRDPFPGDRDRNTAFPDGIPHLGDSGGSGGSSGGSHGGGWSVCRHTRWC
ncbi:PASTA domain-containing protein [Streptomyces griseocarneus]|uniref:PASTA domain-containing protein n=1 Tax=Streptomyces griseocarneus TaxID=51201 RepID=UPI00167CDEC2|nr:PASTA domain-containing protein [Streptomyces griseocarneus]MBZ6477925.1 PASTA domain-containing protein [Streptomyces griseocarneus]